MKRLTDHSLDNYNDPGCQNCSDYCWRCCKEDDAVDDCAQRLIYNRLAAYEDTGLEPEEINSAMCFLSTYRGADHDGRMEFLLDKSGYCPTLGLTASRLRELARADKEGRCVVLPCKQEDILWTFCTYPSAKIYNFKVTDLSTLNGRTMLNTDIMSVIDARDVGKTVFLTREEAEAALKEARDD